MSEHEDDEPEEERGQVLALARRERPAEEPRHVADEEAAERRGQEPGHSPDDDAGEHEDRLLQREVGVTGGNWTVSITATDRRERA